MQERHKNRKVYFEELAVTSRKYFFPYIDSKFHVCSGMRILEIGCGDGGILLPFSEIGCKTTGVDLSSEKIMSASRLFEERNVRGEFIAQDIFTINNPKELFDIIICHDVLEHIENKSLFLLKIDSFLKPDGIVFMSFPAWQMPFGGHQQVCKSKLLSHLPWFHLLPAPVYKFILKSFGEDSGCIKELLSIKKTKLPIEAFEKLIKKSDLSVEDRQLWFINPHYETKFGLKPRKLNRALSHIPYIRNFFCTSCFYILKKSVFP